MDCKHLPQGVKEEWARPQEQIPITSSMTQRMRPTVAGGKNGRQWGTLCYSLQISVLAQNEGGLLPLPKGGGALVGWVRLWDYIVHCSLQARSLNRWWFMNALSGCIHKSPQTGWCWVDQPHSSSWLAKPTRLWVKCFTSSTFIYKMEISHCS